ncbi:YutD family protein [Lactobacillus sp. Sy-1]|uniref:YutD family protein n=1 Tax=Lactobacillus sp. Sy-1 TaxID=2109645 RepID=UPI001C59B815|nr:YutD family protein [Lactobacillus sp. Sy-1]MBW1605756.1 YutD family protein [Lactobacillus sp. Sy-1]
MDRNQIEDLFDEQKGNRKPLAQINQTGETDLSINGYQYQLVANEGDAFDLEVLRVTYNTFFSKYDYILGDVGYGQLRLTGFYTDERNVNPASKISAVSDFLVEYCNFGAPYFILHNLEAKKVKPARKRQNLNNKPNSSGRNRNRRSNAKHSFIEEKITKRKPPIEKRKSTIVSESGEKGRRHFKIRQRQK